MSFIGTNRIAYQRKKKKWSQSKLAEAVGVHLITISKLERGRMQLTQEWLEKISHALSVTSFDLLPADPFDYSVALLGIVKNGYLLDRTTDNNQVKIRNYEEEEAASVWVMFSDQGAWPRFRQGDLVRFEYWPFGISDELTGRACMYWHERRNEYIVGTFEWGMTDQSINFQPFGGALLRESDISPGEVLVAVEARYRVRRELRANEAEGT